MRYALNLEVLEAAIEALDSRGLLNDKSSILDKSLTRNDILPDNSQIPQKIGQLHVRRIEWVFTRYYFDHCYAVTRLERKPKGYEVEFDNIGDSPGFVVELDPLLQPVRVNRVTRQYQ